MRNGYEKLEGKEAITPKKIKPPPIVIHATIKDVKKFVEEIQKLTNNNKFFSETQEEKNNFFSLKTSKTTSYLSKR